ncbi:MAG: PilN domain-containing protein [Potamolinea sp.]
MYSLDINFLKDPNRRPEERLSANKGSGTKAPAGSLTPLFLGIAVGILPLGLVGGLFLFTQHQTAQKQQELTALNGELDRLKIGQKQIDDLKAQTNKIQEDTNALITVFDQIKPWSAVLQDIRSRVTPGLQISSIQQTQVATTAAAAPAAAKRSPVSRAVTPPNPEASPGSPSPQASPKDKTAATAPSPPQPITKLDISGTARSFDEVNYFMLGLQQSSFFKKEDTQLISAQLVNNPTRIEVPQNRTGSGPQDKYELPKVVQYKIQTIFNQEPASKLLAELERKGALGLVNRIKTIQQIQEKGDSQP